MYEQVLELILLEVQIPQTMETDSHQTFTISGIPGLWFSFAKLRDLLDTL